MRDKKIYIFFFFFFFLLSTIHLLVFSQGAGYIQKIEIENEEKGIQSITTWDKTYGGSDEDFARCIIQTTDDGYALAGITTFAGETWEIYKHEQYSWVIKLDSEGGIVWNRAYGGNGDFIIYSIIQTTDGGYALAGYNEPESAYMWITKRDARIIKVDGQGELISGLVELKKKDDLTVREKLHWRR